MGERFLDSNSSAKDKSRDVAGQSFFYLGIGLNHKMSLYFTFVVTSFLHKLLSIFALLFMHRSVTRIFPRQASFLEMQPC